MKAISFFVAAILMMSSLFAEEYFLNSPEKNLYEVTALLNSDYVFRVDCRKNGKIIISDSLSESHELFSSCWQKTLCNHGCTEMWTLLDENEQPGYYIWKYKGCYQKFVFLRGIDYQNFFSLLVTVKPDGSSSAKFVKTNLMQYEVVIEALRARERMTGEMEKAGLVETRSSEKIKLP